MNVVGKNVEKENDPPGTVGSVELADEEFEFSSISNNTNSSINSFTIDFTSFASRKDLPSTADHKPVKLTHQNKNSNVVRTII